MNIGRASGKYFAGRRAIHKLRHLGRESTFAAPGCARDEVGVRQATTVVRSAQIIERNFRRECHRSGTVAAPGGRNHSREMTETCRDYVPDFCLNFLNRARGIDDADPVRVALGQIAVGTGNIFVKFMPSRIPFTASTANSTPRTSRGSSLFSNTLKASTDYATRS